jgi:hypothetical protein
MADHAREKTLSDPQLPPLRDGDPPREVLIEKLIRDIARLGPSCDNGNYAVSQLTLDEARAILTFLTADPPREVQQLKFQRFQDGVLVECDAHEFASWLNAIAEHCEIHSDSKSAVIGLAAQALSALLTAAGSSRKELK